MHKDTVVSIAVLAVLLAFALRVRMWRGTDAVLECRRTLSRSWPLPLAWLDAFSRAMIPMNLAVALLAFGLLMTALGNGPGASLAAKYCGLVGLLVLFFVVAPIIFFNRPSSLVPVGLRQESGLIMVGLKAVSRIVRGANPKSKT